MKFRFTEVLSWISHVWSIGRVKSKNKKIKIDQTRHFSRLIAIHCRKADRYLIRHLWWGKWLITYQAVLPILAILLLTRCSGTLSESCLTGSNWYGCILVTNSKHWFTTSFLWRKVPESDARSVSFSSWPFCSDSPKVPHCSLAGKRRKSPQTATWYGRYDLFCGFSIHRMLYRIWKNNVNPLSLSVDWA